MYQKLTERVPLFGIDTPWTVRTSFVLFVLVWFWELNAALHVLSLTKAIPKTPKIHAGFVLMCVIWGGWMLFNVVLLASIAYRGNWARVMELIATVFGMVLLLTLQFLYHRFNVSLLYLSNAAATALLFTPSASAWFGRPTGRPERRSRA